MRGQGSVCTTAPSEESSIRESTISAAIEATSSLAMMKSRLIVIILGVAVASSFVAIYSAMSSTSLDESSDSEAEVIEGSYQGHRRSLLMKKWKARKMCPPGLDICRDEEKRKAEEIAERRNAKEEREKEEAKELEELSDKVLSSSSSVPFILDSASCLSFAFFVQDFNFQTGGCFLHIT